MCRKIESSLLVKCIGLGGWKVEVILVAVACVCLAKGFSEPRRWRVRNYIGGTVVADYVTTNRAVTKWRNPSPWYVERVERDLGRTNGGCGE